MVRHRHARPWPGAGGAPRAADLDSPRWYDHFEARRDRRGTIRAAGVAVARVGRFATPAAPRAGHRAVAARSSRGGGVAFVDVIPASRVAGLTSQRM
jgi:hypothetical protein